MARPKKFKKVCCLPENTIYGPLNNKKGTQEVVLMTIEEYEVIRIIDFENQNQEECAQSLGVGRSTVQKIYDDARKKIADSLVNGKTLRIEGGDYKLCSEFGEVKMCNKAHCHRRKEIEDHSN